jgi:hypothetical protein
VTIEHRLDEHIARFEADAAKIPRLLIAAVEDHRNIGGKMRVARLADAGLDALEPGLDLAEKMAGKSDGRGSCDGRP